MRFPFVFRNKQIAEFAYTPWGCLSCPVPATETSCSATFQVVTQLHSVSVGAENAALLPRLLDSRWRRVWTRSDGEVRVCSLFWAVVGLLLFVFVGLFFGFVVL